MAEPRWLTDAEQAQWRTLLETVRLFSRALERQLLRDAGMPHAYYGILVALNEAPAHRLRMGDLAANVGFSPSRLSHAVARMEQTGWITRRPRPSSGRERDAELTERGKQALTQAAPGHVALVRELLFDRLDPEEMRGLQALCERIVPAIDDETDCPPSDDCAPVGACAVADDCGPADCGPADCGGSAVTPSLADDGAREPDAFRD